MALVAPAVSSFADLHVASKELYKQLWTFLEKTRPRLDVKAGSRPTSWLGEVSVIETLLVASVLMDEDGTWEHVPPSRPGLPAVKETSQGLVVRLARSASQSSERYVLLSTVMESFGWIWPGVLTFPQARGAAADKLRLAQDGRPVSLVVDVSPAGVSVLKVIGEKVMVEMEAEDVRRMGLLSSEWLPTRWESVKEVGPWGRPAIGAPPPPPQAILAVSSDTSLALQKWGWKQRGEAEIRATDATSTLVGWLGLPHTRDGWRVFW